MANPSAAKVRRLARRSSLESHTNNTVVVLPSNLSTRSPDQGRTHNLQNDVAITNFPPPPTSLPRYLSPPTPSMSRPVRLLIASLGNPAPYHSTRHSAGHVLLRALATHLNFPPLTTRSKEYGN